MRKRQTKGFTLVELMVVISVIAILMGITFRLMNAASQEKAKAETVSRLQRLENALSGYYAAYGTYPPVKVIPLANVLSLNNYPSYTRWGTDNDETPEDWTDDWLNRMARAQQTRFFYPYPYQTRQIITEWIKEHNHPNSGNKWPGCVDAHTDPGCIDPMSTDWKENRAFGFGLMSFLLPRLEMIGFEGMPNQSASTARYVATDPFFLSVFWLANNLDPRKSASATVTAAEIEKTLLRQHADENEKCARWLPNLEGMIKLPEASLEGKVLGVNIKAPGGPPEPAFVNSNGRNLVLRQATVLDGWGKPFFYYSPPPHQSYRLWSAGPDGKTVPPWVTVDDWGNLSLERTENGTKVTIDRKHFIQRTADDIVGGVTGGK